MEQIQKRDDGVIAITILIATVVIAIFFGMRVFRNKKSISTKHSSFAPPPERETFLRAKEQLQSNKPSEADELKKLLMKRAIKTIPILLQLQNEGTSIERLYKKGMLTDDMHYKMKEIKAFVDQEFQDIKFEADELMEGWGEHIWPQAMQYHQTLQKQIDGAKSSDENSESKNVDDGSTTIDEQQQEVAVTASTNDPNKADSEEKKKQQKKKAKK